jgi:hypothetical protein
VHTIGTIGSGWRASVTAGGRIEPWDGEPLAWYVAADDRWHDPEREPSVRQRRVNGTPVIETRLRVPQGDVVHTVYSVADLGGITVIEVTNESTLPVAVAFDRAALLTERPIADVPIRGHEQSGIELPAGSFVLPLGHRATIRVGLRHAAPGAGPLPGDLPASSQVVRGWSALLDRSSRFVLPDGESGATLAERVTAERCGLMLSGPADAGHDPVAFAVAVGELVRLGERVDDWLPALADAVSAVARLEGWAADVALAAAGRVLHAAGEQRALRDLSRIIAARPISARPDTPPDGVLVAPWLETLLATPAGALFPDGYPTEWLGQPVEAFGVPVGAGSTVSVAVRWHGARPAVLWERHGDPVVLTAPSIAPGWSTTEASGETLWPAPAGVPGQT